MARSSKLAALALALAAGTACGSLHALEEYYPDGRTDSGFVDDSGSPDDTGASNDTGSDTGLDSGGFDSGFDTGADSGTDTGTNPDTGATMCDDSCFFAADGWCDDGGSGSATSMCSFGTDCTDCGARAWDGCRDTCAFAGDGECDDGGPGSDWDLCDLGSDCTDCGPR